MTHITPRAREEVAQLEPIFEAVEASMGLVPRSMSTMANTLVSSSKISASENLAIQGWIADRHD
jgi:hypothetical protein